ncbi:hypothetical protein [Nocardioides sp. URHA0020]|uniref:hypothetical protein n=1 Tax=Nocardioides sp. URHA0020 TaxID=1380392 RepID=UPI00048FD53C|nr:hypothetical protein [Nocardioides sp. URHA0020]
MTGLVARVLFFGGLVVLCLFMRSTETEGGNRTFLLVLAALAGALGLYMIVQSALGLLWLRGRKRAQSA